jgi:hypothetical protein
MILIQRRGWALDPAEEPLEKWKQLDAAEEKLVQRVKEVARTVAERLSHVTGDDDVLKSSDRRGERSRVRNETAPE